NLTHNRIKIKMRNFKNYVYGKYKFNSMEDYILSRDLYSEGMALKYDSFLNNDTNFWIKKIEGFKRNETNLIIEELNIESTIYEYDEIDSLVLGEIDSGKLKFKKLKNNMLKYIEEDSEELLAQFDTLFKNRLRNYIKLKVITIFE
ncbi:MAG TPA: hypothetical protein VNJ50_09980, partial [Gelidibacter sp.]|uniref:hypothetical protein n=1 Tax=Gelidibacter sp. TaxID=2018083 RepID=UPI002D0AE776